MYRGFPGKSARPGPQGNAGPQGIRGEVGETGPTGPTGHDGATGPTGPSGPAGATGAAATIAVGTVMSGGYGEAAITNAGTDTAAVFDFVLPQGPTGPDGETGPTGPPSINRTMIAFASTHGPSVRTNASGQSLNAAPLGFAFGSAAYTADLSAEGNVNLYTTRDRQFAFSIPYDCTVENIYITCGPWDAQTAPPNGSLIPVVQLFRADAGDNIFTPITETKVMTIGLIGTNPAGTMTTGSLTNIGTPLSAGDRILIVGMLETTGTSALTRSMYIHFTGGISLLFSS